MCFYIYIFNTHTCIHTCIPTYIHTYILTCICIYAGIRILLRVCAYAYVIVQIDIHKLLVPATSKCYLACTMLGTISDFCLHNYMRTCTQTYILWQHVTVSMFFKRLPCSAEAAWLAIARFTLHSKLSSHVLLVALPRVSSRFETVSTSLQTSTRFHGACLFTTNAHNDVMRCRI